MTVIRVSENQARLIFGSRPAATGGGKGKTGGPRIPKRRREDLPENQVESQVLGFLQAKGWHTERNHVGTYVPLNAAARGAIAGNIVRIGTPGKLDYTCRRPVPGRPGIVQEFDLEVKGPGGELRRDQRIYIDNRRRLGFLAVWFDDLNRLIEWHRATWENT